MVYKYPLRGILQYIARESYEFVIPKGIIHLGEKFVRELSHKRSLFLAAIKGL